MKSNRRRAHVAYIGPSRSAKFYVLAVDVDDKLAVFIYGKNFLNLNRIIPRKGWHIEYTRLPKGTGKYIRGTEASVIRQSGRKVLHNEANPKKHQAPQASESSPGRQATRGVASNHCAEAHHDDAADR